MVSSCLLEEVGNTNYCINGWCEEGVENHTSRCVCEQGWSKSLEFDLLNVEMNDAISPCFVHNNAVFGLWAANAIIYTMGIVFYIWITKTKEHFIRGRYTFLSYFFGVGAIVYRLLRMETALFGVDQIFTFKLATAIGCFSIGVERHMRKYLSYLTKEQNVIMKSLKKEREVQLYDSAKLILYIYSWFYAVALQSATLAAVIGGEWRAPFLRGFFGLLVFSGVFYITSQVWLMQKIVSQLEKMRNELGSSVPIHSGEKGALDSRLRKLVKGISFVRNLTIYTTTFKIITGSVCASSSRNTIYATYLLPTYFLAWGILQLNAMVIFYTTGARKRRYAKSNKTKNTSGISPTKIAPTASSLSKPVIN